MATVYLGRATGSAGFEKLVAIKVIHPHLAAEPDLVDMFLDEARIAARIHSPHVVEILDLGHEDGDYYMVLEFVDGETLSALLRALRPSGRLPLPAILQILADACEGLRAAHDLRDADGHLYGLIHRDVSPQNLLIDLSGWVKIVDFGIMKARGKRSDTRTGQLRGKFPYMSPEQAQSKPLTTACDLFALGVILWELCTGQRLFAGETDVETLNKVIACERPPLAEVRPDLPAGLELVLSRTLARDPADRYSSAAAMLVEVRALQREHAGEVDARAQLAALMRSTFGGQAEYRRASQRMSRPAIALVPAMGEGEATRPDGSGSPLENTTRRGAPALSVVPPPIDPALESGSGAHAVLATPLPGQPRPVSGSQVVVAPTTRAWALWIALPLVGAAIAILTLVASGVLGRSTPTPTTPITKPPVAPVEPLAAATPTPTAPTIRWIINSDPVGASVAIRGATPELEAELEAQLADKVTPLEVTLPRGEESTLTLEVSLAGYLVSTERRLPLQTENLRYVLRPIPAPADAVDERRPSGKKTLRFVSRTKTPATKTDEATTDEPLPTEPNFDKPLKRRTPEGG